MRELPNKDKRMQLLEAKVAYEIHRLTDSIGKTGRGRKKEDRD
jgi:hypothetical protein